MEFRKIRDKSVKNSVKDEIIKMKLSSKHLFNIKSDVKFTANSKSLKLYQVTFQSFRRNVRLCAIKLILIEINKTFT